MAKTDLEIAQEATMLPIQDVAKKVGIQEDDIEYYGKYKAKLSLDLFKKNKEKEDGKLILVTAINPTKAGEGKSTTTVGLGDGLNRLGKKTVIALREPSLGPCFGICLWFKGWSCWRRLCSSSANGRFKFAFHRGYACHYNL